MNNTKKDSIEQNPEETLSGAGLDMAFVLSNNESLLLSNAGESTTAADQSLLSERADSKEITNTDNGFSDSTSYYVFPDACAIINKSDAKEPIVCPEIHVNSVDESCSCVSNGELDTEGSPENVKNKTLSELLANMIQTILKGGPKKSKSTEKVVTSYLNSDRVTDKLENNICHSPRKTGSYFPSSLEIADSDSKLITILEGTNESASNLFNGSSPNWSRMRLGKLRSYSPHNNVTCDTRKRETSMKNYSNQNGSFNGFTSNNVDTSQSLDTSDVYFDTLDSSIHENLGESGSEYGSVSELSSTGQKSDEMTNDITESTFDNRSEESIASKISLKSKSQESNKEGLKKPYKSILTPLKKKKRLNRSSPDTASINVTLYDASGKDNACTPIRSTKGYALQKTPQCTESAKKNALRNRISTSNSPRVSDLRSPVVLTSSIKPVKFLRNLFHNLEKRNRGLGRPPVIKAKKIVKPMILVTPASPLCNQQY